MASGDARMVRAAEWVSESVILIWIEGAPHGHQPKTEGPPLAGRPFHCLALASSSDEPNPRGGGHAHLCRRSRRGTMRHSTTSFPLLNDSVDVGSQPPNSVRQVAAML